MELDLRNKKTYIIRNGLIVEERNGSEDYDICLWQKAYTLQASNQSGRNTISLNGQNCDRVKNGVNILVYDELLHQVVGILGIDAENEYKMAK